MKDQKREPQKDQRDEKSPDLESGDRYQSDQKDLAENTDVYGVQGTKRMQDHTAEGELG